VIALRNALPGFEDEKDAIVETYKALKPRLIKADAYYTEEKMDSDVVEGFRTAVKELKALKGVKALAEKREAVVKKFQYGMEILKLFTEEAEAEERAKVIDEAKAEDAVPAVPEVPKVPEVSESSEALEEPRVLTPEIKSAAQELKNLLLSKGVAVDEFVTSYKAFRVEMKKIDPEFYKGNQDEWIETLKDLLREAFTKINAASGKADLAKTRREAVKVLKAEMNRMLNLLKEREAVMKQSKMMMMMTAPVSDAPAAAGSVKEATVSPD
jgi:inorganic pyrophosphatase